MAWERLRQDWRRDVEIFLVSALIMVLLADPVTARWQKMALWFIVTGLAAPIMALALMPLDWSNQLKGASEIVAAPVSFGGLLELSSLATGIRALAVLVELFCAAALLTGETALRDKVSV